MAKCGEKKGEEGRKTEEETRGEWEKGEIAPAFAVDKRRGLCYNGGNGRHFEPSFQRDTPPKEGKGYDGTAKKRMDHDPRSGAGGSFFFSHFRFQG